MNFFKTVSLEEAKNILKDERERIKGEENIHLMNSLDRILSEDIYSPMDLPTYNRSTVDGYGVVAEDCQLASETFPTLLHKSGEIGMGEISNTILKNGETIYIPTGAMVPEGCDGVVMVEYCDTLGDEILINRGVSKFENVIKKGDEIQKGELLIEKNTTITPYHVALLAAVGKEKVNVLKKIKSVVISTGDEIISLGEKITPGKVYDINSYSIESYLKKNDMEIISNTLVKDDRQKLKETLIEGIEKGAVIFISGGSSVGIRDFTVDVIKEIGGEVLVHGIEIKPGKPTIIARCGNSLVIGLPGHPQSALNVLRVITEELTLQKKPVTYGKLLENISGEAGKTLFVNVNLIENENEILVKPLLSKSSMIRPLVKSQGYIIIPNSKEGLYKDEKVKVILNG
ncbi:MAG: molybdopterin molybdotransferase MoeA [Fusobacteriaceae bacterium]